ncbi:MAG TPA: HutD family protein [Pseudoxanthomonas sp.]|nr:HutD family protein [Pseudoxanthomonas sp.]
MNHSTVIAANDYRRERWKNGRGWTLEIVRVPDHGQWDWRLSIAEIEGNASFSEFRGMDRELVLLQGDGLRLRFDDGEAHTLHPPHQRMRFPGERAVDAEPVNGLTHAFNLMWRRDTVVAELLYRPLVGPMLFFADPHTTWAVHLIAGQAKFDQASGLPPLWQGDTALLVAGQERTRYVLEGGGELLAIKLTPPDRS